MIKVANNLYNISLDQKRIGFRDFISAWVYRDKDFCFLVDPGPKSTIDFLRQVLVTLNIGACDLDYILLTHIHVDHAGGIGKILSFFPRARVICHPQGIKHLINPEKLWAGTRTALGDLAEMYGDFTPVSADRIQFHENIANGKIKVIETLGHAPHHISFLFEPYLFVGEAAGVYLHLPGYLYLRPATPPIFRYDISLSSIEKLLSNDLTDCKMCYGHCGIREDAESMLRLAKEQLSLWMQILDDLFINREQSNFEEQIIEKLSRNDQFFAHFDMLDDDIKARELNFVRNSINGILNYIENKRNIPL